MLGDSVLCREGHGPSWAYPGAVFTTADCFAADFVGKSPVAEQVIYMERDLSFCGRGESSVSKNASVHHGRSAVNGFLRAGVLRSQASYRNSKSSARKDVASVSNKGAGSSSLHVSNVRCSEAIGGGFTPFTGVRPVSCEGSRIPVRRKVDAAVRISESVDGGASGVTGVRRPINCEGSRIPVRRNSGGVVQSTGEGYPSPCMTKQPSTHDEHSGCVSDKIGEARAAATVLTSAIVCEAASVSYVTRAAFIACRA